MNTNLLVFSLLLVFIGFGFGLYLVSFFGLLLLIPSLLPSRTRPRIPTSTTVPSRQQPRRIAPPPPVQQYQPAMPASQPKVEVPLPAPQAPATYTSALFPGPLLPPISQLGTFQQSMKEPARQKPEERDELLEVGAILALLRLALG